jgi:hypothetical protein
MPISRAGRLLLTLCLSSTVVGCDSFMTVNGRVTRCSDGTPIVGVKATLTLQSGVSSSEEAVAYTSPNGDFTVTLNEPQSASARLALEKPGYTTLTQNFADAPDDQLVFCLAEK